MKTAKQAEYVSKLIKAKSRENKIEPLKKMQTTDYMRNCIFWIDEFIAGRSNKEKLNSALESLQMHIDKIIVEHLK